jgi:hypothetical protein
MSYTRNTPILDPDPQALNTEALLDWAIAQGGNPSKDYLDTIVYGSEVLGIDPVVMLAQSDLETDTWDSTWWRSRRNPAGLGITGDPAQNEASQTWLNGQDAAYGHLAHMSAYLWGEDAIDHWPETWPLPIMVDKRFTAPIRAGYRAKTLQDLNGTWAIDAENAYGDKLASRANRLLAIPGITQKGETPAPTPPSALVFGKVPHPPHTKVIVSKEGGGGFDRVAPRRIVGGVHHETLGVPSNAGPWYAQFFGCPGGERCGNALVDYVIEKDGDIYMLNDPRGTRSPWASGGGVGLPGGLEGDGPAFVAEFGVSAINGRNVSIEYVKLGNENFTDKQVQSGGALMAYWHDQDSQPWSTHPYVARYNCVVSFLHYEFGTTSCGKNEEDDIGRVQAVSKGIMQRYQTGAGGNPVPPDVPPQPPSGIPGGLTLEEATKRFGTVTVHDTDGTTAEYPFKKDGAISLAWAHRAAKEGVWPEAEDWYILEDSDKVFQIVTFANDWRLVQVAERAGWQWMTFNPVAA